LAFGLKLIQRSDLHQARARMPFRGGRKPERNEVEKPCRDYSITAAAPVELDESPK
jgi:hypothetical protein